MTKTVALKDVRDQLSELVAGVTYGEKKVVITRFGKPVAALVTYDDYEKIINPTMRFTKKEWEKGFLVMDKMRKNVKKYSKKNVEKTIKNAVDEVRKSKRV